MAILAEKWSKAFYLLTLRWSDHSIVQHLSQVVSDFIEHGWRSPSMAFLEWVITIQFDVMGYQVSVSKIHLPLLKYVPVFYWVKATVSHVETILTQT